MFVPAISDVYLCDQRERMTGFLVAPGARMSDRDPCSYLHGVGWTSDCAESGSGVKFHRNLTSDDGGKSQAKISANGQKKVKPRRVTKCHRRRGLSKLDENAAFNVNAPTDACGDLAPGWRKEAR
jgi:hypothetical protein